MRTLPISAATTPLWPIGWKHCLVCAGLISTVLIFGFAGVLATFPGDQSALEGFRSIQSGWLDSAALAVTTLGGQTVATALMVGLIALLVFARRRVDALVVLISAVPIVVGLLLKWVVGRARPDYFILGPEPNTLSFPSGHALFAIVFGGLLIILSEDLVKPVKLRRAIQFGLALLILAVGASRVYMGVHYPSDVLGSYLYGAMALLGLAWLRNWFVSRSARPAGAVA